MKFVFRRVVLGVGSALVVGGWGMTQFAAEQRQAAGSTPAAWWGEDPRTSIDGDGSAGPRQRLQQRIEWATEGGLPSMYIFLGGVLSMAVGAGLMGWTIPRPRATDMGEDDGEDGDLARPEHIRLPS